MKERKDFFKENNSKNPKLTYFYEGEKAGIVLAILITLLTGLNVIYTLLIGSTIGGIIGFFCDKDKMK